MFNLTTKEEIDSNTQLKPGIYKLYWVKDKTRKSIPRICATDNSGLLYIGKTDGTLRNRLNQFRCTAFLNSTNHSGALKYRTNPILNSLIKQNEIFAEVYYCNNPLQKEQNELKAYTAQFGEVPPLNG